MHPRSLFVLLAALGACADQPESASPFAVDQAAVPMSTLGLSVTSPVALGDDIRFTVTGATPGDHIAVAVSNGIFVPNLGACYPFLGGNCLDMTAGSTGYMVVGQGTANASGTFTVQRRVPLAVLPGRYAAQAQRIGAGNDGNESSAVYFDLIEGCTADAFEPNDRRATASPMPAMATGLGLCPGDEDYYEILVPAGGTLEVVTTHAGADGDLDMTLVDDQGDPLDIAQTANDTETLLWYNSGADRTVFARVYAFDDPQGDGIPYDLESTLLVPGPCVDDAFEDDDTPATARTAGVGTYSGTSCSGDYDTFAIALNAGELLTASLSSPAGLGDTDVVIVNAAGTQISNGPDDLVSYTATANETVYARVLLTSDDSSGGGNTYDVTFATLQNAQCPDDVFESGNGNDSRSTAVPTASFPPGTYSNLGACVGDEDWYEVPLTAGQVLSVSLNFSHADSDVDVRIYRGTQTQSVAVAESSSDNEVLDYTATQTATYYIRVYVYGGSVDGPPITGGALYELVYDVN
ncbi:MAG: PPC domain-containing protein [Alphaproteobacteria bacterium]|nr:PPC domain-containing protein [Alphaproteobacteria bacterium]